MNKQQALWPDPPTKEQASRHAQKSTTLFTMFVSRAGFSPEEADKARAAIDEMNDQLSRAFSELVEPFMTKNLPLPDENRMKYMEQWVTAGEASDQAIQQINDKAADALEASGFMSIGMVDLTNTQQQMAFYERYQKGTPEDLVVTNLIKSGPPTP